MPNDTTLTAVSDEDLDTVVGGCGSITAGSPSTSMPDVLCFA